MKEKFKQGPSDKVNLMDYMIGKICDSISTIETEDERMKKGLQMIRSVIKAAPDMYFLLIEIAALFRYVPESGSMRADYLLSKIEEVLKKARGEE